MAPPIKPPGLGTAYNVAHFGTAYLNVPPNLHRLRNAVGLTAGIFLGRRMMDIIVGQTPDGEKVDPKDLAPVLRPLHGLLPYDHFSDKPHDRWLKVMDMMVPGVMGGIGAGLGSASHYTTDFLKPVEAKMGAAAKDFTLADAERRALYDQSKPWSVMSSTSSVFGSASGFGLFPNPVNYSSTLGTTFTLRAERAMAAPWIPAKLRGNLFNAHTLEPFRPTKAIGRMIDKLVSNPSLTPQNFEEVADGILKTWFRRVTPEQMQSFKDVVLKERNSFIHKMTAGGKTLPEVENSVRAHLNAFLGTNHGQFENVLIKAGIDPREAAIGDNGMITTLARWSGDLLGFGTTKKLKATQDLMIKGLEERHHSLIGKAFEKPDLAQSSTVAKVAAGTFLGTGAGMLYAISTSKDTALTDLRPGFKEKHQKKAEKTSETLVDKAAGLISPVAAPGIAGSELSADGKKSFAERVGITKPKHRVHSKKDNGFMNGAVLDTAEGITGLLNASIGMHRIHCAVGLTVGSWLGDEVMKALTATTFAGQHVKKEEVLKPLRKFYKAMEFNPHSDMPKDKWMQVVRWGVPAIVGTAAVIQSSKLFFEDRSKQLKNPKYLDDYESKAGMVQAEPWSYTSAISGLFGFPTGMPMLPLVNYSTNLGSRFSIASGRKVALPIVGKVWSNNDTLFPFGPPGMIDMMIREAVNNKRNNPELLETFAIGALKPWFANVQPEQVESFVMKVHEVRDKYLKEGGVPDDMKKQLEQELKDHFKGAGLEHTLTEIGLDPLNATIGSNGLSGSIANALGAGSKMEKLQANYKKSYAERVQHEHDTKPDHTLST